ncbi:MAG: pyruvate:ferredoxin (flavodoxin) oxidoreductase [Spirochaetes bacterium RBG_16_49_21]|nr:MAG: pyruvate:ferredoxin (flavodoxin) oxidoreductase [Spirochaetes bacterium RBG_16_49_21]
MLRTTKTVSMDGNTAAAHIAYAFTEVAAIYPITPSSTMAECVDEWSAYGKKNIFGEPVRVVEMQSEAGAAGAVHGSLQAGALTTTFTASQGLLLMIPNMYKISGELLPCVMHVSARSLSTHALSIFGDHSDVYAARQTGFAMLAAGSVQQVMDLAGIAHLAAIKSRVPFLHFFDGFRTSHEIQNIEVIDYKTFGSLLDYDMLNNFRNRALNPETPVTRGTAMNPDIYFQLREAANTYYKAVPDIVAQYMLDIQKITGREYSPFVYYGAPDPDRIIIAMGSVTETIRETVDYLCARGEKVGLITVHLYRPFSVKYFFDQFPSTVKKIAVLDRTKEPGSPGEPLYLDILSLFDNKLNARPFIIGGRYGLSSKDVTPRQIMAVFEELTIPVPGNGFTIGIRDDVTHTSLSLPVEISTVPDGTFEAKFYGVGSDGTVGANKNSIKIIGDGADLYAQAYFAYDSKKSGGVTVSHLRFGKKPITSTYLVTHPDFVACHVPAYLERYDMLAGLKKGGAFLLNSPWDEEETKRRLPAAIKSFLAQKDISFFIINASKIAEDIGLPGRTNSIMQAAFFKVAGVISYELAEQYMKEAVKKTYGKKGDDIVAINCAAIEHGGEMVHKVAVPTEWKTVQVNSDHDGQSNPDFISDIVSPINRLEGNNLPVSAFTDFPDGTFPQGTAAYEKRGIATYVPDWVPSNCIQCNQCAYVCPHAVIRPFLLDDSEVESLPSGVETLQARGKSLEGYRFRIQISTLDCYGCGSCVEVCPSKEKSLVMKPIESQMAQVPIWDHFSVNISYKDHLVPKTTVKGSQFAKPLLEFHGACAGCGETPHYKLITQLFGDRMMIANATGCSSIYCGSAPSTPFTVNSKGRGPAWASSLFEDNAEYGYGMNLGYVHLRSRLIGLVRVIIAEDVSDELRHAALDWLDKKDEASDCEAAVDRLFSLVREHESATAREIFRLRRFLRKRSIWIVGGDGWAYDIGFGGLDHVIAMGEDVNILVLDTEVYSNTGGQSSKSTPTAAIAKFAASGKRLRKKDLGLMAMSYGYVYVAQVSMGANQAQYLCAVTEAEAYPGPSLIIAYSPCINHGIRSGMGSTQKVMKNAVACGYWHLYRYNPLLEREGKNPFILDSPSPDWNKFRKFLMNETRYTSLKHEFPGHAEELFEAAEENARNRYNTYSRLAGVAEQSLPTLEVVNE